MGKVLVKQGWIESVDGNPVKSEGYSLHLKVDDVRRFWAAYALDHEGFYENTRPDFISYPAGDPVAVGVTDEEYLSVASTESGKFYQE